MDDDDGDDDCGYLPKRQDRRERERGHHACPALSSSKREFALGRPRRTQTTPLSVCVFCFVFFFNSAQAPGDIMRRELDFFCYIFRECTLTTYLPTLCKKRNPWRQHEIYPDRLLADISFSPYIQKIKNRYQCVPYRTVPERNLLFCFFLIFFYFFFHQNIPYEYPLLEGVPHEYMYPGILLLLLLPP